MRRTSRSLGDIIKQLLGRRNHTIRTVKVELFLFFKIILNERFKLIKLKNSKINNNSFKKELNWMQLNIKISEKGRMKIFRNVTNLTFIFYLVFFFLIFKLNNWLILKSNRICLMSLFLLLNSNILINFCHINLRQIHNKFKKVKHSILVFIYILTKREVKKH